MQQPQRLAVAASICIFRLASDFLSAQALCVKPREQCCWYPVARSDLTPSGHSPSLELRFEQRSPPGLLLVQRTGWLPSSRSATEADNACMHECVIAPHDSVVNYQHCTSPSHRENSIFLQIHADSRVLSVLKGLWRASLVVCTSCKRRMQSLFCQCDTAMVEASTVRIVSHARQILASGALAEPFRRSGELADSD